MQLFIEGTSIIRKTPSGQIICSDLYLDNYKNAFIPSKVCNKAAISIINEINFNGDDISTMILNSNYFRLPGLEESILSQLQKPLHIISDIDFIVNCGQIKEGDYTFIDIQKDETMFYLLSIDIDKYSISFNHQIQNASLKESLSKNLQTSADERFFNTLFSFKNINSINHFLKKNQIEKTDYADLNFLTSKEEINKYTKVDLLTFFESLSSVIQDIINLYKINNTALIVKSPLTSYFPVKDILDSNTKSDIINELDLFEHIPMSTTFKKNHKNVEYDLKLFPMSNRVLFPFSTWILSESDNLTFEIIKTDSKESAPLEINLTELLVEFADSFFLSDNKSLVKYFIELKYDCCNNLHLRIKTYNDKEFFYLID